MCVKAETGEPTQQDVGDQLTVTASFGVAYSDDASDLDDLVQRADQALFNAKRGGRDLVCLDGCDEPVAQNLTAIV